MATFTATPTVVDSNFSDWTLAVGASKVAAVTAPDDDNTSYIVSTTAPQSQQFFFNFAGIPLGSTINTVTVRLRHIRDSASGSISAQVASSLATNVGAPFSPGAAYATTDTVFNKDGAGNGWTASALSTNSFGVLNNNAARQSRVSTIEVIVDYTPPAPVMRPMGVFNPI